MSLYTNFMGKPNGVFSLTAESNSKSEGLQSSAYLTINLHPTFGDVAAKRGLEPSEARIIINFLFF